MQFLTLDQLDSQHDQFDADVGRTPEIDRFCSSSDWIVPAARELMPEREPFIHRDGGDWVAMMRGRHGQGWRYLEPLEASWGLASPIIGNDPVVAAEMFVDLIRSGEDDWEVMLLSGLTLASGLHREVLRRVSAHYEVMRQSSTLRHIAHLGGGLDGFLGRRSRNFRRSLRRADQRARSIGIEFESCHLTDPAAADAIFDRILAVERTSWKGSEGVGINVGSFGQFYRVMIRRLVQRRGFRAWFARHQGRDVAYCFGGILGDSYRGLQMSYHADYRGYSPGNLCQLRQIEELCAEGFATYDLGTGLEYKTRWAESVIESDVLIVIKL